MKAAMSGGGSAGAGPVVGVWGAGALLRYDDRLSAHLSQLQKALHNQYLKKNNKSFWVPPFFKKAVFPESSRKNLTGNVFITDRRFHEKDFETVFYSGSDFFDIGRWRSGCSRACGERSGEASPYSGRALRRGK
ncbi:hypothetical protein GOB93_11205 [Acetobacter musti]|uniref:Uncharacterized protein n=1 Tax=Acetobacter musti TaxID=864732 RepID=A0ABX0JTC7_9PROT|nr:hypothetical protein [Acetobacter musti]NHN85205.1 hypothetical protein [Acetobacter musti]